MNTLNTTMPGKKNIGVQLESDEYDEFLSFVRFLDRELNEERRLTQADVIRMALEELMKKYPKFKRTQR